MEVTIDEVSVVWGVLIANMCLGFAAARLWSSNYCLFLRIGSFSYYFLS